MKTFLRNFTALSLLAIGSAACAPSVPGPMVSAPPTNTGSGNNGQVANGGTGNTGSAAPISTPSSGTIATATLHGKVYDEAGRPVSDAQVKVKSLNPANPFESTVAVMSGAYVVNEVPSGVLLEVTAFKAGWTQRTKVETLIRTGDTPMVNFGGPNDAYFLSDYPEISAIAPAPKDASIDPNSLVYKLTLSEALDDANRKRLENALRLLPANDEANGGLAGTTTNLEAQEDAAFPFDLTVDGNAAVSPYQIKKGSTFMEDANRRAKVTWSADGLQATMEFNAPLIASNNDEAEYQLALVSEGIRIVDPRGKQLGTNAAGSLAAYPAAGKLILSAIKAQDIAIRTTPGLTAGSLEAMWAATHLNAGAFKVKEDGEAPKLMGVEASQIGSDTRLELTFSEAMTAYNGTLTGYRSAELVDLANYTFAIAEDSADLEGVKLDGTVDAALIVNPLVTATFGAAADREKEFRFDAAAFAAARAGAPAGSVVVEVDPLDAKRVFLYVVGRPAFFDAELSGLKARVADLADPAGNLINKANADANIKMGAL